MGAKTQNSSRHPAESILGRRSLRKTKMAIIRHGNDGSSLLPAWRLVVALKGRTRQSVTPFVNRETRLGNWGDFLAICDWVLSAPQPLADLSYSWSTEGICRNQRTPHLSTSYSCFWRGWRGWGEKRQNRSLVFFLFAEDSLLPKIPACFFLKEHIYVVCVTMYGRWIHMTRSKCSWDYWMK